MTNLLTHHYRSFHSLHSSFRNLIIYYSPLFLNCPPFTIVDNLNVILKYVSITKQYLYFVHNDEVLYSEEQLIRCGITNGLMFCSI